MMFSSSGTIASTTMLLIARYIKLQCFLKSTSPVSLRNILEKFNMEKTIALTKDYKKLEKLYTTRKSELIRITYA
jgi:hypothetical protein